MKQKYFMRGTGSKKGFYRIVPELRSCIGFEHLNLMDKDYGLNAPQQVIFCRNVMIYFDRPTQLNVLRRFHAALTPGGFLFLGHSEALHGVQSLFLRVGPVVYKKKVD